MRVELIEQVKEGGRYSHKIVKYVESQDSLP
jgi:hypothetical protein